MNKNKLGATKLILEEGFINNAKSKPLPIFIYLDPYSKPFHVLVVRLFVENGTNQHWISWYSSVENIEPYVLISMTLMRYYIKRYMEEVDLEYRKLI
jgi:hypothetical protein